MKCPYCGYAEYVVLKHKNQSKVLNNCGRFFRSPGNSMQLERKDRDNFHINIVALVGCPKCRKVSLDLS